MIMRGLKETDGLNETETDGEEEGEEEREGEREGEGKQNTDKFSNALPYAPLVPVPVPVPSPAPKMLTERFSRPIPLTKSPIPRSHLRPRSATFTRKMPSKLCISLGVV